MLRKWTVFVVIGMVTLACIAVAAENKSEENMGAKDIVIAASKGNVPFSHAGHQKVVTDCNACHGLYSKEPGVIVRMKAEGRLEAKQVMNKQCIKCHRDDKNQGKETGPTSCSDCHKS